MQSYTREDSERWAFSQHVEAAFAIARARIRQRAMLIAVVISLIFSAIAVMLWVGGNDVLNGNMTGGELGAFVFYAIVVAAATATISEVVGDLQRAAGAAERLFELMQVDSVIDTPREAVPAADLPAEIRMDNVTFHYPSRPQQAALQDFDLSVKQGQSLALVGPSGAGKSTVFELLQRFYDPQQGQIWFGTADLRSMDPADLRRQIAVVAQQPTLFSGDVMHNIRYGDPDADEQQVIDAARAAHADEFIQQLPQGYYSDLGEQGVRLSGGQRQRIAIARAVLKNPRVLLLDEATSALDSESEHHVQQALQDLQENRTTIIIAHRLSTILHADKIAVLDGGQVVALGRHHELLHQSSLYRRLADLQFNTREKVS